jgi:hypothetical protein
VTVLRLVLDVRDGDRDAALLLFRSFVDLVERGERGAVALIRQHFRDRRGQCRLSVVDMTHRSDVHVRLAALELCLCHPCLLLPTSLIRLGR